MSENPINENPSIMEQSPRTETPEGKILPSEGLNFVFDAPRFGKGGLRSLKATLQANPNIKLRGAIARRETESPVVTLDPGPLTLNFISVPSENREARWRGRSRCRAGICRA